MRPIVIGLCGRAGSGKSSLGRHLAERWRAELISFATPLKEMAMDIWGFTEEQVFGEADVKEAIDPRWDISPHQAMQKLGQAARDHIQGEVWIDAAFTKIGHGLEGSHGVYVIEDVHYRNEAAKISEATKDGGLGGHVWRLHCEDSISTDAGDHPSEAEVDLIPSKHITAELYSSRQQGLEHLFAMADALMEGIR